MAPPHHRRHSQQRHSHQSEDTPSFGAWLRQQRRALDLTQEALAARVGCARITIRRLEADELKPSRELALLLAGHLGLSAAQQEAWLWAARSGVGQPAATNGVAPPPFTPVAPEVEPPVAVTLPPFLQQPAPFDVQPRLFVAREPELAQLQRWLDLACAGQGRVAFVTGEAGSGKSTLVQEFARRAQLAEPALVVATGSCQAFAGIGDPYLPFRELLALLTGDVEARWAAGAISRDHATTLWALLPQVAPLLLADSPNLINTFIPGAPLLQRAQLAAPAGAPWVTQLATLVGAQAAIQAPRMQQQDLFAQITRLLLGIARRRPLLLLLDDLQWADVGSLHLLFHLGRQLVGSHILLLGLYRPADLALGRPAWLSDQPAATAATERHPLAPVVAELQRTFGERAIDLQQADGRTFIGALLASLPHRLRPTFAATLYQHTEGQALFTVELLRALQARGDLVQDAQGVWLEGPTLNWETLPAQVEGMIGERIGRLPQPLQTLLTIAAVEGETFTAEVIATVQGATVQGATVQSNGNVQVIQQLSNVLDKQHGLVRVQDTQHLPTGRLTRYRFRHHLFQTYLYQRLDAAERMTLHEAVGQALVQQYGEQATEIAPQLVRHFEMAGLPEIAIDYLLKAGEQARCVYLNTVAIDYFQRALEQLASLPRSPAWHERELSIISQCFAALVGLGKAYFGASKLAEAENCFRQAIAIRHDPSLSAVMTARLYYWLAETLHWQNRHAERLAIGQAGLALLDNRPFTMETALMNDTIAWSYWCLGNVEQAIDFAVRNKEALASLPYSEELGGAYIHVAYITVRGQHHLAAGVQWINMVRRKAEQAGDFRLLARTYFFMGAEIAEQQGDLVVATREMAQAVQGFAKIGDTKQEIVALSRLAWILIRRGQLQAAEGYLREADQKERDLGRLGAIGMGHANMGLIHLCRAEWQAVETNLLDAMTDGQKNNFPAMHLVWTNFLLGHVYGLQNRWQAARQQLAQTMTLLASVEIQGMPEAKAPNYMRLLATLEHAWGDSEKLRSDAQLIQQKDRQELDARFVQPCLQPCLADATLTQLVYRFSADGRNTDNEILANPAWQWCDPLGDCDSNDTHGFTLRAANGRDLYRHNQSAPRLLRVVCGDFAAETTCLPVSALQPAIGGLLLWADARHYLTLNKGLLGADEISFRGRWAGQDVIVGRGQLSAMPVHLRLERSGVWVRALCSADGNAWFTVGQVEFPATEPLQIGLYAVGDIDRWFYPGAYPDGTAIRFAEFVLYKRK